MTLPTIYPGAEPFFFPGASTRTSYGALCIHGLSASPQEVYWLGQDMGRRGIPALGVRLPGHGTQYADSLHVNYLDWYTAVMDGYHQLRGVCDQVVVMGLSLGGLLAILLASDPAFRDELGGLVVMGSPFFTESNITRLTHVLRYINFTAATWSRAADPLDQLIREQQAVRGERVTGRGSYYRMSAAMVAELLKTQAHARDVLDQVQAPTLLVYSQKDRTAPIRNFEFARTHFTATKRLETLELTQSGHIIPCDMEREIVFARIAAFIETLS